MTIHPVALIARREMREILSDWRIIVPVAMLALVLPLIMANAAAFVIDFLEDDQLADALIPFTLLLIGFIPASFSIVTALEAFVGERERNTLESLLSMPVADRDLYLSKLAAALLTPLLASLTSMVIFTTLLYTFYRPFYVAAISAERLLLLLLLVQLLAVVMVASAVVVSSHMSSIRAANLMSSFILLPAALLVQIVAFLMISGHWPFLWLVVGGLAVAGALLVRLGLLSFNREEILSREQQAGALSLWLQRLIAPFNRRAPAVASTSVPTGQPVTPVRLTHWQTIITIASRELHETLTDWRVLLPIAILTFGIPLALVAGTDFAVDFIGDAGQVARIIPFAVLVVGFVPSSFSLITALEAFVGERERGSLEALLGLPISDYALYAGKLGSSLVVPLLTSFSAMLFFSGALAVLHPTIYFVRMDPSRLLQLLLIISILGLVMVAGAVVISSHTGSIRAANLLASFILIPVTSTIAIQFPFFIAQRWDLVWLMMAGLVVVGVALVRTGLMTFNREEILSREHEQLSLRGTLGFFLLCLREYQPPGVLAEAYRGLTLSAGRFYRVELPALLHELRWPLVLALIGAVSGALLGHYFGSIYTDGPLERVLDQLGTVPPPGFGIVALIFANNLRVSLLSNIFSLFGFGIFAFLVPLVAFGQIGFVAALLEGEGGSWFALGANSPLQFVLAYVLPHGLIELPTFLFSAALGIRIGASVLSPPKPFTVGQNIIWALANYLKAWLLVLLPLVLLGALIEGLVTPLVIVALYGQ